MACPCFQPPLPTVLYRAVPPLLPALHFTPSIPAGQACMTLCTASFPTHLGPRGPPVGAGTTQDHLLPLGQHPLVPRAFCRPRRACLTQSLRCHAGLLAPFPEP